MQVERTFFCAKSPGDRLDVSFYDNEGVVWFDIVPEEDSSSAMGSLIALDYRSARRLVEELQGILSQMI